MIKIAYRDQNFGIDQLVAIQDVRNEFNLQDIDESTVIKDKGELEIFQSFASLQNFNTNKYHYQVPRCTTLSFCY